MRAFISSDGQNLIAIPNRCGSSYFTEKHIDFGLIHFNFSTPKFIEVFKNFSTTVKNKFFLYRDPMDRYLSYYNAFCFGKTITKSTQTGFFFTPPQRSKNLWEEACRALPKLEKNFEKDAHTNLQTSYFQQTDENIEDYTIIDVADFQKFIYLNFRENVPAHTHGLSEYPISYQSILYLSRIQDCIKNIYAKDYELLQPRTVRL